jgi:hypothetical protein
MITVTWKAMTYLVILFTLMESSSDTSITDLALTLGRERELDKNQPHQDIIKNTYAYLVLLCTLFMSSSDSTLKKIHINIYT